MKKQNNNIINKSNYIEYLKLYRIKTLKFCMFMESLSLKTLILYSVIGSAILCTYTMLTGPQNFIIEMLVYLLGLEITMSMPYNLKYRNEIKKMKNNLKEEYPEINEKISLIKLEKELSNIMNLNPYEIERLVTQKDDSFDYCIQCQKIIDEVKEENKYHLFQNDYEVKEKVKVKKLKNRESIYGRY